jgi:hypothetical protein
MAKNRLDYETAAGEVSEADTFMQVLEHLRLAQEACYVLGHLRKAQDDLVLGTGWIMIGEMLARTHKRVTELATSPAKGLTGWRQ